ncbi:hypothetical protein C2G38_2187226 [Gigaspora rosea]|uniref:Uncharacterized protein n=1 Tax=Gigaspora rosea TaxID=44941 RepID=A0A397VBV2_9GLOM|nr:hypothetical protein C2G38_2187226 [Gigaspora rosea]
MSKNNTSELQHQKTSSTNKIEEYQRTTTASAPTKNDVTTLDTTKKKISNAVKYVRKKKHYKQMKDLSSTPAREEPRHDEKKKQNTSKRKPKTQAKEEPRYQ